MSRRSRKHRMDINDNDPAALYRDLVKACLDMMLLAYEDGRLGDRKRTLKILVARQIDPTNLLEVRAGREWIQEVLRQG